MGNMSISMILQMDAKDAKYHTEKYNIWYHVKCFNNQDIVKPVSSINEL